jgi:hypothetical protein
MNKELYTARDLAEMQLQGWPSEISEFKQRVKSQGWAKEIDGPYRLCEMPLDLRNKVNEWTLCDENRRLRVSVDILRHSLFIAQDTLKNVLDWESDTCRESTEQVLNQALLIVEAAIEGAEHV